MVGKAIMTLVAVSMATLFAVSWPGTATAASDEGLDAAIVGLGEFTPGSTGVVQISIQNNKTIEKIDAAAGQAQMSQYYGSAVSLTARLEEGNAPIAVKTEKVLLGTLPLGMATEPVPFAIEVDEDADPGVYQVKLILTYRTLLSTRLKMDGGADFEWSDSETESMELDIEIKEEEEEEASLREEGMDAAVVGLGKFTPGNTGIVQISVQNNNIIDEIDAAAQGDLSRYYGAAVSLTARLEQGNAPIAVETKKVPLGTLAVGMATDPLPFAIEVDEEAETGVYQVKLLLTYRTLLSTSSKEGGADLEWSDSKTESMELDIEIEDEEASLEFEILNIEADLRPGAREEIRVEFKNCGSEAARDSEARISAHAPLSVTDNRCFLGTLEAGESAVATFGLKAAGDALSKEYALDALVSYSDGDSVEHMTKDMKVPITVGSAVSVSSFMREHLIAALVGGAVVAAIFLTWHWLQYGRKAAS